MSYKVGDEPVPGYRLVKRLGRGSYGQVWKARGRGDIDFALKIISLENRGGLKEFKALRFMKSIRHSNLTPIVAFWLKDEDGKLLDEAEVVGDMVASVTTGPSALQNTVAEGSLKRTSPSELIIVMGLGDKTLSDRLEECQQQGLTGIPSTELLEYMKEAAKAIDFLNSPRHDLGHGPTSPIQHCDIKPQNILTVGGSATVCDFGLAREFGADVKMTSAGATLAYGAPELLEQQPPSPTTDQYSLAITYVELRTGRLPFANPESQAKVIEAHLHGKLDLSWLPAEEREVIQKATSRDPSKRYESALRMAKALEMACPDSINRPRPIKRREEPDGEILRGYRLREQNFQGACERIWSATGPDHRGVSLLVHDLASAPVDEQAIAVLKGLPPHRNLSEMHTYCLLDAENRPWSEQPTKGTMARHPSKLVIVFNSATTLADRSIDSHKYTPGGMTDDELLGYIVQMAEAVDYLNAPQHVFGGRQYSILHCNLRPRNFLLERGHVRLANFASARLIDGAETSIEPWPLDDAPLYEPPEMRGGRLTRWSDQYALAICYVELRTASESWSEKRKKRSVISQFQNIGGVDLSELHPIEREAIERATAIDPASRFENCREFVEELRSVKTARVKQPTDRPITDTVPLPSLADDEVDDERGFSRGSVTTETPNLDSVRTDVELGKVPPGPPYQHPPEVQPVPDADRKSRRIKAGLATLVAVAVGATFLYAILPSDPVPPRPITPPSPRIVPMREDSRTATPEPDPPKRSDPPAAVDWQAVIAGRIEHADERFNRQEYFEELKKQCERAKAEGAGGLVNLALAESLMETASKPGSAKKAAEIDKLLSASAVQQGSKRLYQKYVLLLAQWVKSDALLSGENTKSLNDLASEVAKNGELGFAIEPRRASLTKLLVTVALQMRSTDVNDRLSLEAIRHPYGENGNSAAKNAYLWLAAARALATEEGLEPRALANLALAAWHRPERNDPNEHGNSDAMVGGELLADGKLGPADRLPLLFMKSASLSEGPEKNLDAVAALADLVEEFLDVPVKPSGPEIVELYTLIDDALRRAASRRRDQAFDVQLARLSYRKGKIIEKWSTKVNLPFDAKKTLKFNAMTEKEAAYKFAVDRDSSKAEYLAALGFARIDRDYRNFDLDDSYRDADQSIKLNNEYHGGYGLKAKTLLADAHRRPRSLTRAKLGEKAVANGLEAVAHSKNDEDSKAIYLLDLAASYIEWSYIGKSSAKELLDLAVEKAEDARNIVDPDFLAYLEQTIGHAYERLASTVTQNARVDYDKAIKAFTDARSARSDTEFLVDRGRCYIERAEAGETAPAGEPSYIESALADLEKAKGENEDQPTIHRWLGEAYLFKYKHFPNKRSPEARACYANAESSFKADMDFNKTRNSRDYSASAERWIETQLDAPVASSKLPSQIDDILKKAPQESWKRFHWLKARSYEKLENWEKALTTYDEALKDFDQTDKSDVELLKGRCNLIVGYMQPQADLSRKALKDIERVFRLSQENVSWEEHRLLAYACIVCSATAENKKDQFDYFARGKESFKKAIKDAPAVEALMLMELQYKLIAKLTVSHPERKIDLERDQNQVVDAALEIASDNKLRDRWLNRKKGNSAN